MEIYEIKLKVSKATVERLVDEAYVRILDDLMGELAYDYEYQEVADLPSVKKTETDLKPELEKAIPIMVKDLVAEISKEINNQFEERMLDDYIWGEPDQFIQIYNNLREKVVDSEGYKEIEKRHFEELREKKLDQLYHLAKQLNVEVILK